MGHVSNFQEVIDDFHLSVGRTLVGPGSFDAISPVLDFSIREVKRFELFKGRDGVYKIMPEGIFRMHEFVADTVELIERDCSPFVNRVDHVILNELQPFVGYLFFTLGLVDELVPDSAGLLFCSNLLVLYA